MATNPKEFRVKNGLEITAGPIKINGSTGTSGQVISSTGTGVEWTAATAGSGSVTSITAGTGLSVSGGANPITTSGTITIDSTVATLTGAQTLTNKTLTSPTLTTPALGTPASGTLTNCTFPTLNQNTTGSAGSVANTLTITSPLSGTSYNGSSAVSIGIPVATASANGYLSSTDWTTFNNKGSGTVTSVTGTSPVVSSGGATPAISMAAASSGVNGYMTGTYATKLDGIATGATANSGTVTSVAGTGNVSGITLTGTVTGSGSLTLGGSIGTLNQNTTGSAGSVTGLTINNSSSAIDPNSVTQNQIGYANSVSLFSQTDGGLYSSAYNSSWIHEIFGDFRTGQIAIRGKNSGTFTAWRTVLDSTNYTSYSPTLTGTGASGSWGISISGSAGSISGFNNPTTAPTANTIAYRTAEGDIAAREIILSSGLSAQTPTVLVSMYPTTNQLVRTTPAAVAAALSGQTMNIAGNATGSSGSCTGNSATATNATSSYQLATNTGDVSSSLQYWQLTGNSTLNPDTDWHYALRLSHGSADSYYSATIAISFWTDTIQFRRKQGGVNQTWRTLLTNANFSTYAFPLTGGGLNGDLNLGSNYLRFDQSGTRSWNMRATGGNLDIASGDGAGDLRYQGHRIPKTFVQSGEPSGTINNGDVWLQY